MTAQHTPEPFDWNNVPIIKAKYTELHTELTLLRQDKAELLAAAKWALSHLQTLDAHKNHRGIVSRSLNSHSLGSLPLGLKLWDKHKAVIAKHGKES